MGYLRRLRYANVFNDFAYDYVRGNASKMKQFKNLEEFEQQFDVDEKLLKSLTDYASNEHNISLNESEFLNSTEQIKENLKAEIARQKWLEEGAYYIFNKSDREINKAIEVLAN